MEKRNMEEIIMQDEVTVYRLITVLPEKGM